MATYRIVNGRKLRTFDPNYKPPKAGDANYESTVTQQRQDAVARRNASAAAETTGVDYNTRVRFMQADQNKIKGSGITGISATTPQQQQTVDTATQNIQARTGTTPGVSTTQKTQPIVSGGVSGTQTENLTGEAAGQVNRDGASSAGIAGQGKLPNGMWDPDYIPGSEDEIMNTPLDQYTRQKWLANFYKNQGLDLDTSKMYNSWFDEAKAGLEETKKETSALRGEIEKQKGEATAALQANQAANQAQFATDREGIGSTSNMIAKDQVAGTLQSRYDTQMSQFDREISKLDSLMAEQSKNYVAGREDQIRAQMAAVQSAQAELMKQEAARKDESMQTLKMLSDSGALANLSQGDIAYLEEGLPGAPPGVVSLLANAATAKYGDERTKTQLANLGAFADLAGKGLELPIDSVFQFAQQTGLPPETLWNFNKTAQSVMADKNLSLEEKQLKVAQARQDLTDQMNGLNTEAAKKVDYLNKLRASGADNETIAAFKQAAGITDYNDPMTAAKLRLDQANATIKEVEAKYAGQTPPEGTKEYYDYLNAKATAGKAQMELDEMGGAPSFGVMDDKVASEIFQLPGKSKYGHGEGKFECGEAFNLLTEGPKVGNSYESKMKTVVKRDNPQVGNGVMLPLPSPDGVLRYGHIETVIASDGDNFTTVSYNRDLRGSKSIHHYKVSELQKKYGNNWGFSNSRLKDEYANKIPKVNQATSEARSTAEAIMRGSGLDPNGLPAKEKAAVFKELDRLKEEAKASGDVLGIVRASAGGRAMSQSALDSLEKIYMVKNQLDSLGQLMGGEETIIAGVDINPLYGILRSNNPYDKKAQLIKAKLNSIVAPLAKGVYGEVGALTASDIDLYSKTIANMSSTAEVSKALNDATTKLVTDAIKQKLEFQAMGGIDVSRFAPVLEELGVGNKPQEESRSRPKSVWDVFKSPYLGSKPDSEVLGGGMVSDQYFLPEDLEEEGAEQITFSLDEI